MTADAEGTPIRLLIVDDYEPLRNMLCRLFSCYDDLQVVGSAATGEEGIELALAHVPDVVVMDVNMPGMGGIEATRHVVNLLPHVRVIAYSAIDHTAAMQQAGAVEFVTKGCRSELLLEAVRGRSPRVERRLASAFAS